MITLQRAVLSAAEIAVAYRVSEKFLQRWSSLEADKDFRMNRCEIPACPCIRTEGKSVTGYPVGKFEEWYYRFFGSGYGCGESEMTKREGQPERSGDSRRQHPKERVLPGHHLERSA